MFKSQGLCQTCGEKACHPERSEGSLRPGNEILRCAQDDRPDSTYVRSREVLSPNVYRDALNAVSRYAFEHGKISNQRTLQPEMYDEIRLCYHLPPQRACNVPRQVGATYKTLWTK